MGQHVTNPFNKLDLERLTLEEAVAAADLILFNDQSAAGKKERKVSVAKFLEVFFPNYLRTSQLVEVPGVLATDFLVFNDISAAEPKERKVKIQDFLAVFMPAYLRLENLAAESIELGDSIPFVDESAAAPKDRKATLASIVATIRNEVTPTGLISPFAGLVNPTGWVLADGNTIGDVGSGATRANADTLGLFNLLWSDYSDANLVIQDNLGTPTVRGVDAATDWAAGNRLSLPDLRGRTLVGKDNMGGIAAGRITTAGSGIAGDELGAVGGDQARVLLEANLPPHTHDVSEPSEVVTSGAAGADVSTSGAAVAVTTDTGTGTSTPFSITQPSIVATYIIKL